MSKEEAVAKVIALAEEQVGYVPYSGKEVILWVSLHRAC